MFLSKLLTAEHLGELELAELTVMCRSLPNTLSLIPRAHE
jgi:hypothetical protein